MTPRGAGRTSPWGARVLAGLHLGALASLVVAQPLLDLLARNPTFFVVRRSPPVDVVVTALGLAILPAAALVALELLAGWLSEKLRAALHLVLLGWLAALAVAVPLRWHVSAPLAVLAGTSVGAGLAFAVAYARWAPVRTLLSVLAPAPLVFAAVFLLDPGVQKTLRGEDEAAYRFADVESETTVVFVVFDELPIGSILETGDTIDAARFPNFARLAAGSTWYRNFTASHAETTKVLPSILTGMEPSDAELLPTITDHPRSLFTLLGGGYRMNVHETQTSLCPARLAFDVVGALGFADRMAEMWSDLSLVLGHIVLPAQMAARLPAVTRTWGGFRGPGAGEAGKDMPDRRTKTAVEHSRDRAGTFRRFVASIDGGDAPTLHFMHVVLPHVPWSYVHTGRQYASERDIVGIIGRMEWIGDQRLADLGFQRHLLQLAVVDDLLGVLLDRLQETGLMDRCLLVVMADHGASFRADEWRRNARESNAREIMHVPLFVKRPGQAAPGIDDRNVESIDLVPSIAALIGAELPWPVDGSPVLADPATARDTKRIWPQKWEVITLHDLAVPTEWPALDLKRELFAGSTDWADIYSVGPHRGLLGRPLDAFGSLEDLPARFEILDGQRFAAVDPASEWTPGFIEGALVERKDAGVLPDEVAVAVNGTLAGVGPTHDRSGERIDFTVIVPETAFRPGRNEVEILAVSAAGGLARLRNLTYTLRGDHFERSDGARLELVPAETWGYVGVARVVGERLVLGGWAGDPERERVADAVLFTVAGHEGVFATSAGISNGVLAARFGADSVFAHAGFRYELPAAMFGGDFTGRLRAWAVVGGQAAALKIGFQAAWLEQG